MFKIWQELGIIMHSGTKTRLNKILNVEMLVFGPVVYIADTEFVIQDASSVSNVCRNQRPITPLAEPSAFN